MKDETGDLLSGKVRSSEDSSPVCEHDQYRVLDLCMASGGFASHILKYYPKIAIEALTLPNPYGGYSIEILHADGSWRMTVIFADITAYGAEFAAERNP